jgi:uncharacterized protein YegP (UPF0339 family)
VFYVIRRNGDGHYWWRAVGGNNEILCSSELMNSKTACINGINVVRRGAAGAPVYDQTDRTMRRKAS